MKEAIAVKDASEREEACPAGTRGMLPEVRIVIVYFVLASAWIIVSDRFLSATTDDWTRAAIYQSLKGLNFVLTTAILLYLVLRHAYGGWRKAEAGRMECVEESRETFRKLCAQIEGLREEERTRISREIHDELGQLLTGLKMELRLLESRVDAGGDRSLNFIVDGLVEAGGLIDETIGSVRRISAGLRPPALDHLGLGTALIEEAERFSQRTGIRCSVVVEKLPAVLPDEIRTAAFRIFQESLTNVARHSGAKNVDARLGANAGALTLIIRDDGRGIPETAIGGNPKSLGLIGMLERAGGVGGSLDFRGAEGGGTEVELTVPLAAAEIPSL